MPLFLIPWAGGAIAGALGWNWLTGSDAPVTEEERSKSRGWYGFIFLALGLVWLFNRKRGA